MTAIGAELHFGQALRVLKEGGSVTRIHWNGNLTAHVSTPRMWLLLIPGSVFKVDKDRPLAKFYTPGTTLTYSPHIDLRTAQGSLVPWIASQSDLLAEDWLVCVPLMQSEGADIDLTASTAPDEDLIAAQADDQMKAARERALGVREQAKRRTLSVREHVKLDENHSVGTKPGADYDPND
jgi:hypothetical protein